MRFRLTLLTLLAGTSFAHAQSAALDDDNKPTRTTDPTAAPDTTVTASDKVQYGVDLRLRSVWIPQGLVDLFVEKSAGGASNTGFGADFVRRRGNSELLLGFEYEHITPAAGVWVEKKGPTDNPNSADYILSPDQAGESLGWFTLEFTFVNNVPINKYVAFRYGGGAGLGILTGGLYRWDVECSGVAMPGPGCTPGDVGLNGTGRTSDDKSGAPESEPQKYGLPPVFPVVNAIVGLQFKPSPKALINLEAGIRTIPFIGLSGGYLF
jgi:hypothetical protein